MQPKFSEKKLKWAQNRTVVLQGKKLNHNEGIRIEYEKKLLALVKRMTEETERRITSLFKNSDATRYFKHQKQVAAQDDTIYNQSKNLLAELNKKFDRLFNLNAKSAAQKMVDNADNVSASSLSASLKALSGFTIGVDFIPKSLGPVINASIAENVALIKSIPDKYFSDITQSVMRSITTGNGLSDLVPDIQKYTSQTKRRVKNIATDQTRKAYNTINKHRMMAVGYKKFKWLHSGGGQHPRRSHQAMNGKIFSFNNLPIVNKEQVDRGYEEPRRGIPGSEIFCGCTMTPVYEFNSEE